jgi:hypothetical protein
MILRNALRRQGSYINRIQGLFGSSIVGYWPLNELSGGVAYDHSGHGYDGAYVGPTLGQPGIQAGVPCPLFDGDNDRVDLWSAALAAAFPYTEGSLMIWAKVFDVGVWTDGVNKMFWNFEADGSNLIYSHKMDPHHVFFWWYGSAVGPAVNHHTSDPVDWVCYFFEYSKTGDYIKLYMDGVQVESTGSGLGNWVGTLNSGHATIATLGGALVWYGWLSHMLILNRPATEAEIIQAARR